MKIIFKPLSSAARLLGWMSCPCGSNGTFKKVHGFCDPNKVPVRGYAANYLAAAMMVVASNGRLVENFYEETLEQRAAKFEKAKKRRAGTWSEDTRVTSSTRPVVTDGSARPSDPGTGLETFIGKDPTEIRRMGYP